MTTKTISVKVDSGNSTQTVDKLDSSMKKLGTSTNKAVDEVGQLSKVSKGVRSGLNNINTSVASTSKGFSSLGRNAGQASIQIQQFTGQVQGGVNPLLALSQQAADLGIVLGAPLLGSIVGIGSALAISFIPQLKDSSEEIKELIDKIEELERVSGVTLDQSRLIILQREKEIEATSKQNQAIAEEITNLEKLQRARTEAGTGTDTGQFAIPRSASENQERYSESIRETNERLIFLRAQLTTNNKTIQQANQEIINLTNGNRELSESQREANEEFLRSIEIIANAQDEAIAQDIRAKQLVESAIERDKFRTEQLRAEIAIRRQLLAGEIDQQTANEEIALQNLLFTFEARRNAILQNEQFTFDEKSALIESLNDQEVAAQEALQLRLTQTAKKGSDERNSLLSSEISNYQNYANTAINLASAFGKKSEKQRKKTQKAQVIINTASGIARAYAENDFYTATGIAALIAANGAAQIANINSASSAPKPTTAAASAAPPIAPQQQQNQQTRIIDLRGLEGDQTIPLNRNQLMDLLQNDDDVILAANNGQQQGQRVGLINAD